MIFIVLLSLISGSFFSTVSAYGEVVHIDTGEGCEIETEEVIVEPDCTDPFFQDMEHKAAQAEVDIHQPVPAPSYEVYPESEDPEFPLHVIFDQPIDVEIPTTIIKPTQKEAPVPAAPVMIPEKKVVQEIPPVIEPIKVERVEVEAQENNIIKKTIPTPAHNEEEIPEMQEPDIAPVITLIEHDSALSPIPQTLTIASVFKKHTWEIIFVSFVIFLLFSLLFIY